jgi:hypothetical protein
MKASDPLVTYFSLKCQAGSCHNIVGKADIQFSLLAED